MARKCATDVKKKALFNFLFNGYYTDIFTIQRIVKNTIKKGCLFRGIHRGGYFLRLVIPFLGYSVTGSIGLANTGLPCHCLSAAARSALA